MDKTLSKVITWAVLLAIGAGGGFIASNVRASRRVAAAQAAFMSQLAAKDAANAQLQAINTQILAQNEALKGENAEIEAERDGVQGLLNAASARIFDLENAEPVQPELEKEPLVINLRFQIAEHKTRYSLAMEDIALANREIANPKIQIAGLEQAYENAMQMYRNSDGLLNDAAKTNARLIRQNQTLKVVSTAGGIVIVVLTIISVVK
jgi:hypothetical protein